ncbi:MAG: hypothetical protein IMX05_04805 [Hydrogenibacillus schlegelii]|nr:hypothetical protein [Hydrogenibacillus schlegelii]
MDRRRSIIVREIEAWREHRLLPEAQALFLLRLYGEGGRRRPYRRRMAAFFAGFLAGVLFAALLGGLWWAWGGRLPAGPRLTGVESAPAVAADGEGAEPAFGPAQEAVGPPVPSFRPEQKGPPPRPPTGGSEGLAGAGGPSGLLGEALRSPPVLFGLAALAAALAHTLRGHPGAAGHVSALLFPLFLFAGIGATIPAATERWPGAPAVLVAGGFFLWLWAAWRWGKRYHGWLAALALLAGIALQAGHLGGLWGGFR